MCVRWCGVLYCMYCARVLMCVDVCVLVCDDGIRRAGVSVCVVDAVLVLCCVRSGSVLWSRAITHVWCVRVVLFRWWVWLRRLGADAL